MSPLGTNTQKVLRSPRLVWKLIEKRCSVHNQLEMHSLWKTLHTFKRRVKSDGDGQCMKTLLHVSVNKSMISPTVIIYHPWWMSSSVIKSIRDVSFCCHLIGFQSFPQTPPHTHTPFHHLHHHRPSSLQQQQLQLILRGGAHKERPLFTLTSSLLGETSAQVMHARSFTSSA